MNGTMPVINGVKPTMNGIAKATTATKAVNGGE